jgi:crossover junction endodeoxyribonuclease RusA
MDMPRTEQKKENEMIELLLPYPPSGNHMWKHSGGRHYLTESALRYYSLVRSIVREQAKVINLDIDLDVICVLHPPDKRRRDLDNAWKVIGDAITKAGVWQDDKFIRRLTLEWAEVRGGGMAMISIQSRGEKNVS